MSEEEKSRGCPICLFELNEYPANVEIELTKEEEDKQDDGLNPILTKVKYVFKTPCGHIFHESCLKNWINLKSDCPSCRRPLANY